MSNQRSELTESTRESLFYSLLITHDSSLFLRMFDNYAFDYVGDVFATVNSGL